MSTSSISLRASLISVASALALPSCVSQKSEFAIVISPVHGTVANVANYTGADAQAKLDELADDFCRANSGDGRIAVPVRVLGRYDSGDRRSHSLEFQCEGATP